MSRAHTITTLHTPSSVSKQAFDLCPTKYEIKLDKTDSQALCELVAKCVYQDPLPWMAEYTLEKAISFIDTITVLEELRGDIYHGVYRDGVLVGHVALRQTFPGTFDLGYLIDPAHRCKGATSSAVRDALKHLKSLHPTVCVVAHVKDHNFASKRVLLKNDFHQSSGNRHGVNYRKYLAVTTS